MLNTVRVPKLWYRETLSPPVININLDGSLHKCFTVLARRRGKRRIYQIERTSVTQNYLQICGALDERMRLDRNHEV